MIIIIFLKLNSKIDLEPDSGHKSVWPLTRIDFRIKMIIIIVLKLNSRVDSRLGMINQAQVTVQVNHWPRVNVRIKMVIIIVLKFNSMINPRQGPDYESGWPMTHV